MSEEEEKVQVNIRIPKSLLETIVADAKFRERAMSNQIAWVLKEHYGLIPESPKPEPCTPISREQKIS